VKATLRTTLLVLVAAAGAFLLAGQAAAAKEPCWKTLIDDWYDGRIDNVYPVPCYRAALEHMPEDVAQYSTLGDDINRALQAAIAAQADGGSNGDNSGGDSGTPTSGVNGETSSPPPSDTTFHGGPTAQREGAMAAGRDSGGGPVGSALDSIGPSSPDSVPVPLIVLGGLSILLLALGAAGFVARRVQTRRAAGGPPTDA
jgi:hypothetical protein